ncbi:MAG: helix-turn-helix transcriptional regulator [Candidatus Berkiella sp.]
MSASNHLHTALKEKTQPLLAKLGCNYFQYLKVFADGSFSFNTTKPTWNAFVSDYLKKINKPAVYSHIDAHTLDKNKYIFLWDPNLPSEPVKLARGFDIAHGLTFVERQSDHYYMIGFGASAANHHALDNYFNHFNEMDQFIQEFKANQKLIKALDNERYVVPSSRQDANLNSMLLPEQNRREYLTPQERLCLSLLAKGLSYKEIALKLKISPRTVETYLNRVRLRFNLRYKKDLITLSSHY